VLDAIDSTFVSSVGAYVDRFEAMICQLTGAPYAVAMVNGTTALQIALKVAGVGPGDLVITQPLTFVATANAITYVGARPLFLDVDRDRLGLSPEAIARFLDSRAEKTDRGCVLKATRERISACVPMHTFGFPARIEEIVAICSQWGIPVVEDAAESMGSLLGSRHTGTFGRLGIFSFNGNKIVTCGGGGALVTGDKTLAQHAKHLSTTAKLPHRWEYRHDEIGYNYRLPNLNAALACAQLEQLERFVERKRLLAEQYRGFFARHQSRFVSEPPGTRSNYWLNTILLEDRAERERFLAFTNERKVMTRPAWTLLHKLPMFQDAPTGDLANAEWVEDRLVNIPSSVILE
jgi:aminotransferase in exopolysaccharide biosynthesis